MNCREPSVSVIVPTYNSVHTIEGCLNSILHEARSVTSIVDVLVIDGGSTDGTVERVVAYDAVRLVTQKSHGLAAARNEAVSQTTGSLVAFCDSDDSWPHGSLALKIRAFEEHPSSWAIGGRVRFVERHEHLSGQAPRRRHGDEHNGSTPGALLIRRSVFDHIAFDETFVIACDADWLMRSQHKFGPTTDLDKVVLEKGIRAGSLSTDVSLYRIEMMRVARQLVELTREVNQQ